MSSQALNPGRSHGVLLSRLLWPTGILFAATLGILFSTILWTSNGINDAAAERQRGQFVNTLRLQLDRSRDEVVEAAEAEGLAKVGAAEMRRRIDALRSKLGHHFDPLGILGADGRLLDEPPSSNAQHLAARFQVVLQRLGERVLTNNSDDAGTPPSLTQQGEAATRSVSELVSDDGQLYGVHTIRLDPQAKPAEAGAPVLVAVERLSPEMLQATAHQAGLEGMIFSRQAPPGATAIPIAGVGGAPDSYIAWAPDRPGDLVRGRLLPLIATGVVLTSILFGFVVVYLRWLTQDLEASQAQSRELLGRDPLSGLANRLLFGERLDAALWALQTTSDGLAVLFIDLDRFKDVNDTYGHQAGDDLIQLVAHRLANVIRSTDTLARLGGDEFAIIQVGVRGAGDAESLARRVLDALTRPFAISHTQVTVGASIGISLAPQDGDSREGLMRLADTALYQAKSEGRNRYSLFQRRMDETIRMRKTVEDDLRRAITEDELMLEYQPLFSSDGETVVGLEALVRWPHPVRGLISPSEFIAIAEERGLIIPLGEWVLRRACEDCKRWPDIRIAVNVSPIQFRHRDYVETVMRVLEETDFDPARLELELTEGVVVEDADAAEAAMMELRALGVHLALDDFGTGYSSLIYLRRFAFDKIKIDRSFLESMEATGESAILVHSIVHLGRALGLTVTAEGVETKEQHRFLQALGCHQLQGFLFSRPLSRDGIDRLLGTKEMAAAAA